MSTRRARNRFPLGIRVSHRLVFVAYSRFGSVAILAMAVVGATNGSALSVVHEPRKADGQTGVVALLASNKLIALSPKGKVRARLSLGRVPPSGFAIGVGNYVGLSSNRRLLFTLEPRPASSHPTTPQAVAVVSLAPLRVVARYTLPQGILFRSLTVGPRTGRLYLAGNRFADGSTQLGAQQEDAVAAVVDPRTGALILVTTIREAGGRNWMVLASAISSDERYLFVAYHGDDTIGGDWLSISDNRLDRCSILVRPNTGCLDFHGSIAPYRGSVLAATGENKLVDLALDGRVLRDWSIGLPRNHLMWITLDSSRGLVAVAGSCGYSGGLSVINLARVRRTVFSYPSRRLCGERVAWSESSILAIAHNPVPVASGSPSDLLFFDTRRHRITRLVATPTEVLDVISVRR